MLSTIHFPVIIGKALCLTGYAALFVRTIRQNRKNPTVVLGVITVTAFVLFLFYADLSEKHAPFLLTASILTLIALTGFCVLAFVALDVIKWASKKWKKSEVSENDLRRTT